MKGTDGIFMVGIFMLGIFNEGFLNEIAKLSLWQTGNNITDSASESGRTLFLLIRLLRIRFIFVRITFSLPVPDFNYFQTLRRHATYPILGEDPLVRCR